MEEEKQRRRLLGRVRQYLARRRSPRSVLSAILVLTALAGFLISMGMLKLGLGAMWLRYPLAVLGAWGVFLALVRSWAERERNEIRVDEELAAAGTKVDVFDGTAGRSVLSGGEPRGQWLDWLDWLNPFEVLELEGCLMSVAVGVAVLALGGALIAIGSLIVQAEALLAEVLLDVILVSALNHRLHKLEPQWWLAGSVRQTLLPVLATMVFLTLTGYLMDLYAPEAESIGAVWRHWRGPQ